MKGLNQLLMQVSLVGGLVFLLMGCLYFINQRSELKGQSGVIINEVVTNNLGGLSDETGDYTDWIELYNKSDQMINLQGYGLSDDLDIPFKWTFPNIEIPPYSFLLIRASGKEESSELHISFKLSANGEYLFLTDSTGTLKQSLSIPKLEKNQSYGTLREDSTQYVIFNKSTPNQSNDVNHFKQLLKTDSLEKPQFSHQGGFYEEDFELELTVSDSETLIFYTLDGSIPDENSLIYSKPISIQSHEDDKNHLSLIKTTYFNPFKRSGEPRTYKATIVRARTYQNGVFSDNVLTQTYFISPDYTLPIISIVTDEEELFGYENGIYVPGIMYDMWRRSDLNQGEEGLRPANFTRQGKESERKVSLEFFEADGSRVLEQDVGIRISGGWTRMKSMKSLNIYARKEYGSSVIDYPIFKNLKNELGEEITTFKSFKLRNSGNDFNKSMFRDALMQSLVQSTDLLTQAYQPAIVFINGEYWGLHNIREKVDEFYLASHYEIDPNQITILGVNSDYSGMEVEVGEEADLADYEAMLQYVQTHDLSNHTNYQVVAEQIDIENFIQYIVSEVYFGNDDWPHNNVRIWRVNEEKRDDTYQDGKWRWILFDTDHGFDGNSYTATQNTLSFLLDEERGWSNILIVNLLKNEEFRHQFIVTFNEYLETIFSTDVVLQKIEEMASVIEPEIEEHFDRWTFPNSLIGNIIEFFYRVWVKDANQSELNRLQLLIKRLYKNHLEEVNWQEEVERLKVFAIERPIYLKQYLEEYLESVNEIIIY